MTRLKLFLCLFVASLCAVACQRAAKEGSAAVGTNAPQPDQPQQPDQPPASRENNDLARFLAGMAPLPGSSLTEMSSRAAWKNYAASFDKNWVKLNKTRLAAMQTWSADVLHNNAYDGATLFYPFSGPDVLHAVTLFPNAGTYVLVALEPIGTAPDMAKMPAEQTEQLFSNVSRSLQEAVSFSFFKTDNMKVDLKQDLDGVLPILMVLLARTGNRIDDIIPVEINDAGQIAPLGSTEAAVQRPRGVHITFKAESGPERHLYYFSVNLEDSHLKRSPAFMSYVSNLGRVNTFVKSASYLMHKSYFSTVRGVILDHSVMVVQDDSGIPYRFYKPEQWNVALYGVYSKPIPMFKDHKEEDLAEAYKTGAPQPLPFGIGYNWRQDQSNLLVGRKKTGA
jgi:hypothetical protein